MKFKVGDLVRPTLLDKIFGESSEDSVGDDQYGIVLSFNKDHIGLRAKVYWIDGRTGDSYCSNLKKVQDD